MRQIIPYINTTGQEPKQGHRIIEIACLELIDRRPTGNNFHHYLQPDRKVGEANIEIDGITDEFLSDKSRFNEITQDFIEYTRDAELIVYDISFEVGFINHELSLAGLEWGELSDYCTVVDMFALAMKKAPGQRNSLDDLNKRYNINILQCREVHDALLHAEIIANIYLALSSRE